MFCAKHELDLRTLTHWGAVFEVPVPYFSCEDSELARVMVGLRLSKAFLEH
jgi:hypothetical protein